MIHWNKIFLVFLSIMFFLIISCKEDTSDPGIALKYLPAQELLKQGIVSKYYEHSYSEEDPDTSTHISYKVYQLKGESLHIDNYIHAKQLESELVVNIRNENFIVESYRRVWSDSDTVRYDVVDSVSINWSGQIAKFSRFASFEWGNRLFESKQVGNKDTMVLERPGKCISRENKLTIARSADTIHFDSSNKQIYLEGIGLYNSVVTTDKAYYWSELVEQMSLDDFLKLGNHNIKRVGYIDTLQTIDKGKPFYLCNAKKIHDYYNGSQKLHYNNGKSAQWKIINSLLKTEKLYNESGYLTYRFVVNCKGETGRFITEEADLDFIPKSFNKETTQHLYEIVSAMDGWIPTLIRGEPGNAYFYLTFKLEDGKIIEILP